MALHLLARHPSKDITNVFYSFNVLNSFESIKKTDKP